MFNLASTVRAISRPALQENQARQPLGATGDGAAIDVKGGGHTARRRFGATGIEGNPIGDGLSQGPVWTDGTAKHQERRDRGGRGEKHQDEGVRQEPHGRCSPAKRWQWYGERISADPPLTLGLGAPMVRAMIRAAHTFAFYWFSWYIPAA